MSQYATESSDELFLIDFEAEQEYIRLQMAGERALASAVLSVSLDVRRELASRGVQFDNYFTDGQQ
jgi:hypothetical protein